MVLKKIVRDIYGSLVPSCMACIHLRLPLTVSSGKPFSHWVYKETGASVSYLQVVRKPLDQLCLLMADFYEALEIRLVCQGVMSTYSR